MLGLKERLLQKTLAEKSPLVVPPNAAMRRVCREFVDQCPLRGPLTGLVDARLLLPHQAKFIDAADDTCEWALRLWSFLARLNWTALHRVGPYLPDPLSVWWSRWVILFTESDQPREDRVYRHEDRDPQWRDREGILRHMEVTPRLIASFITRGLLNRVPGLRKNHPILDWIEKDGEAWQTPEELHHQMRNALFETRQNSAASCV
jgi:hypothetical protein